MAAVVTKGNDLQSCCLRFSSYVCLINAINVIKNILLKCGFFLCKGMRINNNKVGNMGKIFSVVGNKY